MTGTAELGGATLDVTSSRTDAYGVLRVLIQNDGTDAVDGTFSGLSEGDSVSVNGVTYWITYQYNAETGQFGSGNDVALVSSLFQLSAAVADPYVITAAHSETATVLDAAATTDTTAVVINQYQLSHSLSQHDPDWAAGNPSITYSSLDSSVATVDSAGLVTFHEAGTCRILATATEDGYPIETFEIRLTGVISGGVATVSYEPITITSSNVGQYVLVLYNADSTDSTALMNYYKANRPGMANANYLGITGVDDASYASQSQCASLVSQVIAWTQAHPTKPIRYIVGLCGLPSRDDVPSPGFAGGESVSYMIYNELLAGSGMPGYYGGMDRFSVAEYGTPLVAWLDCGSYAATYAYINKEVAAADAGGLEADGITISGSAAGVGGSTWVLDDTCHDGNSFIGCQAWWFDAFASMLAADGVPNADIDHQTNPYGPVIATAANPTAYGSWGVHSGELGSGSTDAWPANGDVTFTGNAGWWIGMSVESYNGIYGGYMGDPTEFFAATAFGGTNYSNTPICFVGSTSEPTLMGIEDVPYFDRWARGWSTIEAAWAGFSTQYFLAVTDICLVS